MGPGCFCDGNKDENKNGKCVSVFHKRYPGSVQNVSAFANLRPEAKLEDVTAICDKSFAKKSAQEEMERVGPKYLIPLKRTSRECPQEPLEKAGLDGFEGRIPYNGCNTRYAKAPRTPGAAQRVFLYLDETLRHPEQGALRGMDMGRETRRRSCAVSRRPRNGLGPSA